MPHLTLAGYFGCGNLGDEAVLLGFVHGLDGLGFDVTVLSGNPDETHRRYGLQAINRRNMGDFARVVQTTDALVFPGGSIFQDATSVKSVYYYADLVARAKKAGKKVLMVGQGVGPLSSFLGKRWAASAFNACSAIAVRDPDSMGVLRELKVTAPVKVTADSALLMPPAREDAEQTDFQVGGMKSIGISPRPLPGMDMKSAVKVFGDLARALMANNLMPVFVEMDAAMDGPMIQEVSKSQGGKVPEIRKVTSPLEMQQRLSRMEAVVAVRLHAGIIAAKAGVPPFMVSYDPKVAAFAKMLGLASVPSVQGLSGNRLYDSFAEFYKNRTRYTGLIATRMPELIRSAQENVHLVVEALGGRR